jgi:hypothetical protein
LEQYIYAHYEEFRGSIKGTNRFIRAGDLIKPEDVSYFQHNYPDRILLKSSDTPINVPIDKEIYTLLSEQNKKIDKLIDIVNSPNYQTVSLDTNVLTNSETNQSSKKIEIQDISVGSLLRINTTDIETQGTVGELKTEGESISDKINKMKLRRKINENC